MLTFGCLFALVCISCASIALGVPLESLASDAPNDVEPTTTATTTTTTTSTTTTTTTTTSATTLGSVGSLLAASIASTEMAARGECDIVVRSIVEVVANVINLVAFCG